MTQDELAGIEEIIARAKLSNGMAPAYDLATIHADALVAEVRRLRALVREAFNEGFALGLWDPGNRDYWPESLVRKTLEGE